MKKQLVLTKINNEYVLSMKEDINRNIKIVNNVVNGEELYEVFYASVKKKNEYMIETELSDHKDKIIFNQLCFLFNKIDSEVNQNCFNNQCQKE